MTLTLSDFEKRWGLLYLFLQLYLVPQGVVLLCAALGIASAATVNLAAFFSNALLAVGFFHRLLRRSLAGFRPGVLWSVLKGFVLYWLLSNLVLAVILLIQPEFSNFNDTSINAMIDEHPVLMPIAVVLAAPLAEECLFRGWIFTGLAQKSLPLAYIVTTVSFAAIHTVSYIGIYDPLTLMLGTAQYLVPGGVLCWVCQKSDSLCAPLLLHSFINTIALFTTR